MNCIYIHKSFLYHIQVSLILSRLCIQPKYWTNSSSFFSKILGSQVFSSRKILENIVNNTNSTHSIFGQRYTKQGTISSSIVLIIFFAANLLLEHTCLLEKYCSDICFLLARPLMASLRTCNAVVVVVVAIQEK